VSSGRNKLPLKAPMLYISSWRPCQKLAAKERESGFACICVEKSTVTTRELDECQLRVRVPPPANSVLPGEFPNIVRSSMCGKTKELH